MRLLPRRARVSDEMTVWLSPHYRHSAFGVRGRYDAAEHTLPYVETGSAGCGFFVRDSQSHAYRHFVDEYKQRNKPTLLNLLLGKEFNINKHISHCQKALDAATGDPVYWRKAPFGSGVWRRCGVSCGDDGALRLAAMSAMSKVTRKNYGADYRLWSDYVAYRQGKRSDPPKEISGLRSALNLNDSALLK